MSEAVSPVVAAKHDPQDSTLNPIIFFTSSFGFCADEMCVNNSIIAYEKYLHNLVYLRVAVLYQLVQIQAQVPAKILGFRTIYHLVHM